MTEEELLNVRIIRNTEDGTMKIGYKSNLPRGDLLKYINQEIVKMGRSVDGTNKGTWSWRSLKKLVYNFTAEYKDSVGN